MRKGLILAALLWVASVLLTGCNLFSFTAPETPDDKLLDAQEEYQNGNFQEALRLYNEILAEEPNNASALYGRAKVSIRATGQNPITLIAEISKLNIHPDQILNQVRLPFMDPVEWNYSKADSLFQAVIIAKQDLKKIYDGKAFNDELRADDVTLDYTSVLALYSILKLRDTLPPYDSIQSNDINPIALFQYLPDGSDFDFENRAAFLALLPQIQADVIYSVMSLIYVSTDNIIDLIEDKIEGIDLEGMNENLNEILGVITDNLDGTFTLGDDGLSEFWPSDIPFGQGIYPWPPEGGE